MSKIEEAVATFLKGFRCSQSILGTFGTDYGLEKDIALRLAAPFGSGMCNLGNACGAVTGALLVLGLKFGHTKVDEVYKKEKSYTIGQEFMQNFLQNHGSIMCKELLGYDISTPKGMEEIEQQNLFETKCPEFVKTAATILKDLLNE